MTATVGFIGCSLLADADSDSDGETAMEEHGKVRQLTHSLHCLWLSTPYCHTPSSHPHLSPSCPYLLPPPFSLALTSPTSLSLPPLTSLTTQKHHRHHDKEDKGTTAAENKDVIKAHPLVVILTLQVKGEGRLSLYTYHPTIHIHVCTHITHARIHLCTGVVSCATFNARMHKYLLDTHTYTTHMHTYTTHTNTYTTH